MTMDPSLKPSPRLRASCDGCYTAKIKCTKERPTCPRCKSLGLVCHYSPSQRAGGKSREARSRPSSSWASQPPDWTSPTNIRARPIAPTDRQPQYLETTSLQSTNVSQPLSSGFTTPDSPGSANTPADFGDDFLAPWRDYLPTPAKDSPSYSLSDQLLAYSQSAASSIQTPSPMNHDRFRSCDCFLSIVQALHSMQQQSKSAQTPPLDMVLSDSRDVIARGEAVLRCTCSDDSTVIMLLTGLIAKHLSLYGSGNGGGGGGGSGGGGSSSGLVSSPSSSSGVAYTESTPLPLLPLPPSRVTIGKYTVDGEDEERLRVEIMMMELQKMGALLMKFRGKVSALAVGYEGHTYETVLNFLHMRLREATEGLLREKERLKADA